jgi:hypothetical protein
VNIILYPLLFEAGGTAETARRVQEVVVRKDREDT